MQVEIESDELQQSEAVATDQQAILELDQQPVVGTEETALDQQLANQPLEQDEGEHLKYNNILNMVSSETSNYFFLHKFQWSEFWDNASKQLEK